MKMKKEIEYDFMLYRRSSHHEVKWFHGNVIKNLDLNKKKRCDSKCRV